jgi:hypothetical protein
VKIRNWKQIARIEVEDVFQIEYTFEGLVDEEWNRLKVNADLSKSLLAEWANWLWREEYPYINLSDAQWRYIEKIVFNEIKTRVERRLQQNTFKNGMTIQLRAPISLPLGIENLPYPND